MASKGPRSKLDHETRAKRQKALEAPKEPLRRKTHWDHVLEEMVWLSKEDDEQTIEADEALITKEERKEELTALHNEVDLPLEELLKRYTMKKVRRESSPEKVEDASEPLSRESTPEIDGVEFEPTPMWENHGKGKGNNLSAVNETDAIATGRHCKNIC